jgi:hypothetical protein
VTWNRGENQDPSPRPVAPHVPRLLRLLAGRIGDLDLDSEELESVYVGGVTPTNGDILGPLRDSLVNLARDVAANDPIYDEPEDA